MKVSILIPARNEEKNIEKCLRTVSWSDDIYVVDSSSRDRTAELARRMGANVVQFQWDGKGARKKNWALQTIAWKHEWVLIVDADEEVPGALASEIQRTRDDVPYAGYRIRYTYYFLGQPLLYGAPLWKLILVRHPTVRYELLNLPEFTGYDVEVHEHPIVQGPIGKLRERMIHRDNEGLHHFFERHNIYSDWEALLRTKYKDLPLDANRVPPKLFGNSSERRRWLKRLFLNTPGRPLLYFLYAYLWRRGFLDGEAGFYYASLIATYWHQVQAKEYESARGLS
ncbi:MAG: glycosyltransferase family 2 protein [Candidatus Binataceae bacterium]